MKTSSAKAKGRRLAKRLRDKLLLLHKEFLREDDIRVTPSGVTGPDLQLSPLAQTLIPFAVECKNCERLNVWDALKQAQSNASSDRMPLLVFSRNNEMDYAVIELDVLLKLLKVVYDKNV